MKPRIAIPVPHSRSDYSDRSLPEYKSAIELSGGEPVEIPLTATSREIAELIKTCDAVLLPGSLADVDSQKFGAAKHPKAAAADPARDNVDELLLQDAHNMRKPLLGICYGIQSLNVWRQGTLVQHIESRVLHANPEDQPDLVVKHEAVIAGGSMLAKIVASTLNVNPTLNVDLHVNSSHHQAVEIAGDGLKVVAKSPEDGVIEAVEGSRPDHWVLGVQWHPERGFNEDEASRAIFAAFIEAARKWHANVVKDFETVRQS